MRVGDPGWDALVEGVGVRTVLAWQGALMRQGLWQLVGASMAGRCTQGEMQGEVAGGRARCGVEE